MRSLPILTFASLLCCATLVSAFPEQAPKPLQAPPVSDFCTCPEAGPAFCNCHNGQACFGEGCKCHRDCTCILTSTRPPIARARPQIVVQGTPTIGVPYYPQPIMMNSFQSFGRRGTSMGSCAGGS